MKAFFNANFLLRPYIAIVAGIILIALLLDLVLAGRGKADTEADLRNTYAPMFSILQEILLPLPREQRAEFLEQRSAAWHLPIGLLQLNDFAGDASLQHELENGKIQVFSTSDQAPVLYQRLATSQSILVIGPLEQFNSDNLPESLIITAYYTLIALFVLFWLQPFYRDLSLLRKAAGNFGKSDFSTRVKLSEKSSILPVAQSFNTMAERIEYLVSAHKELTHAVSHELRTPLARFRFSLEILARNTNPEKKQHYLDNMKTDVVELETLIDELLSYARLSEENLLTNLVDMDMRSWLKDELQVYAGEKIHISASFGSSRPKASYTASFNPALMSRALHNVVRNGLRYAQSSITVHLDAKADHIEILVCDDGPGIPAELHASIFEPFARLESSRDKSTGGYGLGLAIAARILERHAGYISFHNCNPHGACFLLCWPGK